MRLFRSVTLAVCSLALAACADDPAGISADGTSPRLVVIPACVNFGPPPPLGAAWGAPFGTPVGAIVFVENGVSVSVNQFFNPGPFYNYMRIENPPVPFGAGQTARANNVNIGFDYANVGFVVKAVKFEWLDLGGRENLIVNGVGPFIGELDTPPASMAGITITPSSAPVPGGDKGTISLTGGVISKFQVGGQELWIDRVCAYP